MSTPPPSNAKDPRPPERGSRGGLTGALSGQDRERLPWRRLLFWVSLLYFAEGFPFGIVYDLLPVYFRTAGVSLKEIGLLSLLGLPWSLKVFWSPLIDRFGDRRRWITGCLAGMTAILLALPFFPPSEMGLALRALLLAFTILSATQDIAIDAQTVGLAGRGQEGPVNSVRVAAYRVALIVAGGGLVAVAGLLSWPVVLRIAAVIAAILAFSVRFSPRIEVPPEARRAVFRPLWWWLRRPGAIAVFAFILTYKVGDASMGPMVKPFWLDRGLTPAEVGLISTTFGMLASVAGALIGGAWIARIGIFRGLWLLGLLQALSNLGYATVAWADLGRGYVYAASVFESFTGGLGTAAFLSFLMRACDPAHAAVQYALLSAIFGFSRSISGAFSGWATERLGYGDYFGVTFLLAFPAYLLLPWVRGWTRHPAASR